MEARIVFPDREIIFPIPDEPIALWHLIDSCNLECAYCYGSFSGGSYKQNIRKSLRENSADLDHARRLTDLGIRRVHFAGGEPLLRQDFWQLAEHFTMSGIRTAATTNGTIYSSREEEGLRSGALHRLMVSIDTMDPSYGNLYREKHSLVLRNLERIVEQRHKDNWSTEIGIYCVVSRKNLQDSIELARWASDQGVDYFSVQPVHLPKDHRLKKELSLRADDLPDIKALFEELEPLRASMRLSHPSYLSLWEPLILNPGRIDRCFAGSELLMINSRGEITSCPAVELIRVEGRRFGHLEGDQIRDQFPSPVQDCGLISFDCICMFEFVHGG